MSRLLALPALLLVACLDGTGPASPVIAADYATFVRDVQPVLAARCANPSCHGRPDRPLEVFAVRRHRLEPADRFRDVPLTEAELRANWLRACAFLDPAGSVEGCDLLTEPLAEGAGGTPHEGGVQFEDRTDGGYRALEAWVAEALAHTEVAP